MCNKKEEVERSYKWKKRVAMLMYIFCNFWIKLYFVIFVLKNNFYAGSYKTKHVYLIIAELKVKLIQILITKHSWSSGF